MDLEVACPEIIIQQDGCSLVSTATQTSDDSELVQISTTLDHLLERIDSFTRFKRRQIDMSNQLEFCHRTSPDVSCARTDAAYVRRSQESVSHITTTKVRNMTGPTPKPLSPIEQLRYDLQPPTSSWVRSSVTRGGASPGLLGLVERVSNMEQYTNLYEDGQTPNDLIQRVINLESRLLQLEGRSQEYQHLHTDKAMKSIPTAPRTKTSSQPY